MWTGGLLKSAGRELGWYSRYRRNFIIHSGTIFNSGSSWCSGIQWSSQTSHVFYILFFLRLPNTWLFYALDFNIKKVCLILKTNSKRQMGTSFSNYPLKLKPSVRVLMFNSFLIFKAIVTLHIMMLNNFTLLVIHSHYKNKIFSITNCIEKRCLWFPLNQLKDENFPQLHT